MITATRTSPAVPQPKWATATTEEYTDILQQPKDGLAIVATGSEQGIINLRGVDAATGKVKWEVDNAFYSQLPPTVGPDGNLYAQSSDGNSIEVRDGKTGKVLRSLPEDVAMYSRVSAGKNLYVGAATTTEQGVFAFDPNTGKEKWHKDLHYLTGITPVEVGGLVFCENGSDVYALDPDTGNMKWNFQAESGVSQSPVLGPDGTLYLVDANSTVYAIDPKAAPANGGNATAKWTNKLDIPIQNPDHVNGLDVSQPLIFSPGGAITVPATNESVRQIDPATGQQKWENKAPIDATAVPGPDGQILVGDGEGILSVNPSDGSSAYWKADNVAPSTSPGPVTVIAPYGLGKLAGY